MWVSVSCYGGSTTILFGFYPDSYTPDWHSLVPTTHPGTRSPAKVTGGDKMAGGDGDDEVHGSNYGDDVVFGDSGDDRLFGHWGNDTLLAASGDDFADGGMDNDDDTCFAEEVINCLSSGEVITPIGTSITLDLPSEVNITETVKITASILESSSNAARNVTIDFYDSTTLIGSNRSDTLGMTSISYTPVAGAHPIKAELMANEHYEASESPVSILNVIDPSGTDAECDGLTATIVGTDGDDVLEGTAGDDVIHGLGGNDTIRGLGGNDRICGGEGSDLLFGGAGDDIIYGFTEDDAIYFGPGDDLGFGGPGGDGLYGAEGNDELHGGEGNDTIFSDGGNDLLFGGMGDDRIIAGDGDDLLLGDSGDDVLFGESGADFLKGDDGMDMVDGGIDFANDTCFAEIKVNCP